MNENQLNFISVYKESVDFFSSQYKVLSASARDEMNFMERVYSARVLSRIGFVVQEMKDLEHDLSNAIQNRGAEINNNNAECILEAHISLKESLTVSGQLIQEVATQLSEDLLTLNEIAVYPSLHEIELLRSIFEVEIFNIFAYVNSVTNMFQLLILLESEVRTYGALFEYYVSEIYVEMIIYSMLTDELAQETFPLLDTALVDFKTSENRIRNSLSSCN